MKFIATIQFFIHISESFNIFTILFFSSALFISFLSILDVLFLQYSINFFMAGAKKKKKDLTRTIRNLHNGVSMFSSLFSLQFFIFFLLLKTRKNGIFFVNNMFWYTHRIQCWRIKRFNFIFKFIGSGFYWLSKIDWIFVCFFILKKFWLEKNIFSGESLVFIFNAYFVSSCEIFDWF